MSCCQRPRPLSVGALALTALALALLVVASLAGQVEAPEKKGAPATPEEIDRLVGELAAPTAEARARAMKRLEEIGKPAIPALKKATAKGADPDVRLRALFVLGRIDVPAVPPLVGKELVLEGHTNRVVCIDVSRDGRWIASGGADRTLRLWDRTTGKQARLMDGVPGLVWCVAFSPDGKHLVAGGSPPFFAVWDAATGRMLRDLTAPGAGIKAKRRTSGAYRAAVFTPDGKHVLFGPPTGRIEEWDSTGRLVRSFAGPSSPVVALAISTDGRYVSSGSIKEGTARLWDRNTGTEVRTLSDPAIEKLITGTAFSRDGKFLATMGFDDAVRTWDARTGVRLHILRSAEAHTNGVVFSADGKRLFGGTSSGTIVCWDLTTGRIVQTLRGHPDSINQLRLTQDGRWLVSAGGNIVRVWAVPR